MSNSAVGNVYQRVIQEVIDASQMDFQDSGVDPLILDQLREVWQQKLTGLNVATFPWDPPPPAPAAPEPEPPKEVTPPPIIKEEEKKIKAEPGTPPPPAPPPGQPLTDPSIAAARAAQHVQNKFGGNVNVKPGSGPGTPAASGGLMLPGKPQPSSQQANGSGSGVGNSQTDGAGEFMDDYFQASGNDVVISRLDADGAIERVVAEGNLMRAQESALRAALDDLRLQSQSTLLSSESSTKRRTKRTKGKSKASPSTLSGPQDAAGEASSSTLASNNVPNLQQMDGPDDEMEDDENAINSDLDDSEDEHVDDDEEADGVIPQIMLCMYDKVQRVKNKWKCVLKDGVLTVNGKEYVFHKATGEYEW